MACGGCIDSTPQEMTDDDFTVITSDTTPISSTGKQVYGNIVLDVPEFVQHWKPDGTCYWEGRIHVINTGTAPEMDVVIRSYLIRESDDEKEWVDSKYLTRVNPDEPLSYISTLYGNCDEKYYVVVHVDGK